VIHVHGNIAFARSSINPNLRYRIDGGPIALGQTAEDGSQLRPDVVWFGEEVMHFEESRLHTSTANKVLVVGTSLAVYPIASITNAARGRAEKVLISLDVEKIPYGHKFYQGPAATLVPRLVDQWIKKLGVNSA
jgi:NAD-dependent deacetylase